jgi:hypothetical protein
MLFEIYFLWQSPAKPVIFSMTGNRKKVSNHPKGYAKKEVTGYGFSKRTKELYFF